MNRSLPTRILHTVLGAAIVHQLVISWLMEEPKPGRRLGNFAFTLHEFVGLASFGVLVLYWIWVLVRRRERGPGALFPWLSAARWRAILDDIRDHLRALARLRLPHPDGETPLASAVHGLGLLIASAMAGTGVVIYATMATDGTLTTLGELTADLHGALANLMWAYLIGHAGIAVLHQIAGHRVFQGILLGDK